jgi:hypothetical protein
VVNLWTWLDSWELQEQTFFFDIGQSKHVMIKSSNLSPSKLINRLKSSKMANRLSM